MNFLETTSLVFIDSFNSLWQQFINFLPTFLGAIIVFIIGWIIAVALGNLVSRVVSAVKINDAFDKLGMTKAFKQAGIKVRVDFVLGWLVKWFLIIVFLIAAADIMNWTQITAFLNDVVTYLPNVVISVVILIIGIVVADFIRDVLEATLLSAKFRSAEFVAGLAKWSILVFSFMAVLVQLGIAARLIEILFTGFISMCAIAGGLAFGLGGKDKAQDVIKKLSRDLTRKE